MMIILIESFVLCLLFTLMVYFMSRDPIKTLYNYPPNIQRRVESLEQYKDKIPTRQNKIGAKLFASVLFTVILALVLKYINGCTTFTSAFLNGFLLWTIVNLYDALVLDIIWFCHDPYFVIDGTQDMVADYHDYLFHLKGFLTGEGIALVVCFLTALLVCYIL